MNYSLQGPTETMQSGIRSPTLGSEITDGARENTNSSDGTETAPEASPRRESDDEGSYNQENMWSPTLSKALRDRYCGSRKRTPRTLTRLMQQHRENERHRHHGLNATIREINRRIPGFEDTGKETKIVKLQRIISYICHLEEHITDLCDDLGIGLDFKNLFLSPHVNGNSGTESKKTSPTPSQNGTKTNVDPKVLLGLTSRPGRRTSSSSSSKSKSGHSRAGGRGRGAHRGSHSSGGARSRNRQAGVAKVAQWRMHSPSKLASLDDELSWLDCAPLPNTDNSELTAEDIDHMLSTFNVHGPEDTVGAQHADNEVFTNEHVVPVTTHRPEPIPPFHTYARSFTAVKTEGQVVPRAPRFLGQDSDDSDVEEPEGLPWSQLIDPSWADHHYQMPGCEAQTGLPRQDTGFHQAPAIVNPTYVMHNPGLGLGRPMSNAMQYNTYTTYNMTQPMPAYTTVQMSAEPPEFSSDEDPFTSMNMNPQFTPRPNFYDLYQSSGPNGMSNCLTSPDPYHWKFDFTLADIKQEPLENLLPPSSLCGPKHVAGEGKSNRVDHRKTSWMNGFMMYSRLHRRAYIAQNPGVHTSHISKLMGQHWRKLLAEDQAPYKEKARQYVERYLVPNLPEQMQAEFHRRQGMGKTLKTEDYPTSPNQVFHGDTTQTDLVDQDFDQHCQENFNHELLGQMPLAQSNNPEAEVLLTGKAPGAIESKECPNESQQQMYNSIDSGFESQEMIPGFESQEITSGFESQEMTSGFESQAMKEEKHVALCMEKDIQGHIQQFNVSNDGDCHKDTSDSATN